MVNGFQVVLPVLILSSEEMTPMKVSFDDLFCILVLPVLWNHDAIHWYSCIRSKMGFRKSKQKLCTWVAINNNHCVLAALSPILMLLARVAFLSPPSPISPSSTFPFGMLNNSTKLNLTRAYLRAALRSNFIIFEIVAFWQILSLLRTNVRILQIYSLRRCIDFAVCL